MYMIMLQYLGYLTSCEIIHVSTPVPYGEATFDSDLMNNEVDFAPIRWSYKKTRRVATRDGTFNDG